MPRKSNYRKIQSGGHVKVKRMIGCEFCNFSEPAKTKKDKGYLKTGDTCPRCDCPTLRLFDSNAEFKRATELKAKRDNNEIFDLTFQPVYPLHAYNEETKTTVHLYDFVADFCYFDGDKFIVEDVKGESRGEAIITDVAKMKIAHFEAEYGQKVLITKR